MGETAANQKKVEIVSGWDGTVTPQPEPASHGAGPVVDDAAYQRYLDALAASPLLTDENVRLNKGEVAGVRRVLGGVGLVGLGATVLGVFALNPAHALAAFEVGVFTALACCLGALFHVMLLHSLNASWAATVRRQLENIASLIWLPLVGMLIIAGVELSVGGVLFQWLRPENSGNFLLEHKSGYLNPRGFALRLVVYAGIWLVLATTLYRRSVDQDVTGDRWQSRRNRRLSGLGLLLFALTTAFATFDFLMSMDFRFFSTMWGVYYFAGAAMSAVALAAVVLAALRTFGKLNGVVTEEHFHDLGKILFTFVVFWTYISFSQYFLIWYGNIPEETAWFLYRKDGGWNTLFLLLIVGHFVVPLLILISRKIKRSTLGLGVFGVMLLVMQVFDMVYVIRPMVYINQPWAPDPVGPAGWWLDVAGLLGVAGVFGYFLVDRMTQAPLIPTKDPRLGHALEHKNYV